MTENGINFANKKKAASKAFCYSFTKKDFLPRVRLELTAFRLWDWRAAYCATEAWISCGIGKTILLYFFFCYLYINFMYCRLCTGTTMKNNSKQLLFWKPLDTTSRGEKDLRCSVIRRTVLVQFHNWVVHNIQTKKIEFVLKKKERWTSSNIKSDCSEWAK